MKRVLSSLLAIAAACAGFFAAPPVWADAPAPPDEAPNAGDDLDDVAPPRFVERDPSPSSGPSPSPSQPASPVIAATEPKNELTMRGFVRATVSAGLDDGGRTPRAAAPDERVPYERGVGVNQMYLAFRYARGDSLRVVLSASLAYGVRMTEGEPPGTTATPHVYGGRLEPVLREAYVGWFPSPFSIRVGQQRIPWGNSDAFAPNDVLNARDLRTRLVFDREMVDLPTLAARLDVELEPITFGLVAQPFFAGDRTSLYGSAWSLVQADAPRTHRRLFGGYVGAGETVNADDAPSALVDDRAPTRLLEGASIGASAKVRGQGADLSFYWHWGYDRTPFVYLDPGMAARIDAAPSGELDGAVIDVMLEQRKKAERAYGGPLIVQHVRRHHLGVDAATTQGPFVLRADAAYDSASTFLARGRFNSAAFPTIQGVAGIEYQAGSKRGIGVEAWYMRLMGRAIPVVPTIDQANDGPLLFVHRNNLGFAAMVRWPLFGGLFVDARAIVGTAPSWFMVRPEIGWESGSSALSIRAGALVLNGEAGSTGGHYGRNDTAYVTARYSF